MDFIKDITLTVGIFFVIVMTLLLLVIWGFILGEYKYDYAYSMVDAHKPNLVDIPMEYWAYPPQVYCNECTATISEEDAKDHGKKTEILRLEIRVN